MPQFSGALSFFSPIPPILFPFSPHAPIFCMACQMCSSTRLRGPDGKSRRGAGGIRVQFLGSAAPTKEKERRESFDPSLKGLGCSRPSGGGGEGGGKSYTREIPSLPPLISLQSQRKKSFLPFSLQKRRRRTYSNFPPQK